MALIWLCSCCVLIFGHYTHTQQQFWPSYQFNTPLPLPHHMCKLYICYTLLYLCLRHGALATLQLIRRLRLGAFISSVRRGSCVLQSTTALGFCDTLFIITHTVQCLQIKKRNIQLFNYCTWNAYQFVKTIVSNLSCKTEWMMYLLKMDHCCAQGVLCKRRRVTIWRWCRYRAANVVADNVIVTPVVSTGTLILK